MKIHLKTGDYIIATRIEFAANGSEIVYENARGIRQVLAIATILYIES